MSFLQKKQAAEVLCSGCETRSLGLKPALFYRHYAGVETPPPSGKTESGVFSQPDKAPEGNSGAFVIET
jgi:hypothetical protein